MKKLISWPSWFCLIVSSFFFLPSSAVVNNDTTPVTTKYAGLRKAPCGWVVLKHLRTYGGEHPSYLLHLRSTSGYQDLRLETSGGNITLDTPLGSAEANKVQDAEVPAPKAGSKEEIPEAIIIHRATVVDPRTRERVDITDKLYQDISTYPFMTGKGLLPLASPAGAKSSPHGLRSNEEIAFYFERELGPRPCLLFRLTLPPEKKGEFVWFELLTSEGSTVAGGGEFDTKDASIWIGRLVWDLSLFGYGEAPFLADEIVYDSRGLHYYHSVRGGEAAYPVPVLPGYDVETDYHPWITIFRAVGYKENGDEENILPRLVQDTFKPLPILLQDGAPLPLWDLMTQ